MEEINTLEKIELLELQKIKAGMKQLYSTWNEIGIEKEQKISRVQTAWTHIQSLVQDICDEEVAVCEELKGRIKEYTEKISELSKALLVETSEVVGLSLLKREEILHQEFNKLTDVKNNRLKELKDLMDLEKHYRLILGMDELKLSFKTEVPSSSELSEIQKYVNMLTEEHQRRKTKYFEARQQLVAIYEEIETLPETSFEKHFCVGKEPLSLSDSTLKVIDEVLEKAQEKKSEFEKQKKSLINKLTVLWERLNIENNLKINFLSNHLDCKISTIKSIQEELTRCEKMKQQNIKSFIEFTRQELNELWLKCAASESEKQLFYLYSSTDATEDVLVAHEQEVDRWKAYYEEVKQILEKIEKRNKLWDLLIEFDKKANDPARFKNRGGNLLKEERERNKLQKSLPALEEEIYERIKAYETETGRKFLYFGEDYSSQTRKQWDQRVSSKENQKQEKLQFNTPAKRPQFATPKSAPCPRFKRYGSPATKFTPKTAQHFAILRPNAIKKRDKDILKEVNKNKDAVSANLTTYSDFAGELNRTARRSFRSSVVASKKIGGTRMSSSAKKKKKSIGKNLNAQDKEHIDLTSVRGKAGLPFLM